MQKTISSHQFDRVGANALAGFFINFNLSQKKIEQSLLLLEISPDDQCLISELQEYILLVQQALKSVELTEIVSLTASLNGLVERIRLKHLKFESGLSDMILLAVNDIKLIMEAIIDSDDRCRLITRLPQICECIDTIAIADERNRLAAIKDALLLLDPGIEVFDSGMTHGDLLKNLFSHQVPEYDELAAYGVEESDDFIFFRSLSEPVENREKYWCGRVDRMLRLALKMNDYAGRPVNPNQLAAAIYMHDTGMALTPLNIINSKEKLSDAQLDIIHQHPIVGYELMRYMTNWREASFIVLQHHEQVNGEGYPYGLHDKDICEGAKILAIVDLVDARTHERVYATLLKRPLLRAAIELGKYADVQFSAKWVNVFKEVFQEVRRVDKHLMQ